tara:strand:+ start:2212 stop:2637 length:426 start_codon:yes stop_codon:yes gene_type:complete
MLISVLLFMSTIAHAEDMGRFTIMSHNEAAPFEGVLFDPIATADILTARSFTLEECDLRTNHELDKKEAEFQLERENFNIRYDALKEEYDLIIEQKDLEITQLRESLLKQSPRNNWWWAAGGAIAGVAITYGAYRAFDEQE